MTCKGHITLGNYITQENVQYALKLNSTAFLNGYQCMCYSCSVIFMKGANNSVVDGTYLNEPRNYSSMAAASKDSTRFTEESG